MHRLQPKKKPSTLCNNIIHMSLHIHPSICMTSAFRLMQQLTTGYVISEIDIKMSTCALITILHDPFYRIIHEIIEAQCSHGNPR